MSDELLVWILRTFFRDSMVIYNAWVGAPEDGKQSAIQFQPGDIVVGSYLDYRGSPNLRIKRMNG